MHIGWGVAFIVVVAIIGLFLTANAVERCNSQPGWSWSWMHSQCLPDGK